jgi:hypothetical protein
MASLRASHAQEHRTCTVPAVARVSRVPLYISPRLVRTMILLLSFVVVAGGKEAQRPLLAATTSRSPGTPTAPRRRFS